MGQGLTTIGPQPQDALLGWALVCLLVGTVAGVFGFGGLTEAAGVAKLVCALFLAIFLVAWIAGLMQRRRRQA